MIDINVIKVGGKYYSVKCELEFSNDEENIVTAKIVGLDMVDPGENSSFRKIKSLFHSSSPQELLSKVKYSYIYDAITKKLIQKYKMKVLNI